MIDTAPRLELFVQKALLGGRGRSMGISVMAVGMLCGAEGPAVIARVSCLSRPLCHRSDFHAEGEGLSPLL